MASDQDNHAFGAAALKSLKSEKHLELLDVIDNLRAQGLNEHVDLPQLIVAGDQSSGKSSVLSAISGVPFPKKDGLCTRFTTEVILRRDDTLSANHIKASIWRSSTRSSVDRRALEAFSRKLTSMNELANTMEDAANAMGLGTEGSAFSADVLRLEIKGPRMPQLTIVDLPGLTHARNKTQSDEDIALVSELVGNYMAQERTIILAVISAKVEYPLQIVSTLARKLDPQGRRTLGIITKPDTAPRGSAIEMSFIELAQNLDIQFSLGWHVVRNLDSNETALTDRDEAEAEFFLNSNWNVIGARNYGIHSLRERLSEVLFHQIQKELPHMISETLEAASEAKTQLLRMGRSRSNITEQRLFVVELGQKFNRLCWAACEGIYEDPFFSHTLTVTKNPRCLRAVVQNCHQKFAKQLQATPVHIIGAASSTAPNSTEQSQAVMRRAKKLLVSCRGKELPGTFNPSLIGQLFHELILPWSKLAHAHAESIWRQTRTVVLEILSEVAEDDVHNICMDLVIDPQLLQWRKEMEERLDDYMAQFSRHPITFNHYLTETVQKARADRQRVQIAKHSRSLFEGRAMLTEKDLPDMLRIFESVREPDMDELAARDLTDYAQAYLKVALKRVIDEVPAHVIEPALLTRLPDLLTPARTLRMPDELIEKIGAEPVKKSALRQALKAKLDVLDRSSLICQVYASRNASVGKETAHEATEQESASTASSPIIQTQDVTDLQESQSLEAMENEIDTAQIQADLLLLAEMPPAVVANVSAALPAFSAVAATVPAAAATVPAVAATVPAVVATVPAVATEPKKKKKKSTAPA